MAKIWQTFFETRKADPHAILTARVQDYRITFGADAGQRVLADICRRAGLMQTTYGEDGATASAYREGRRRMALEIVETLNTNPESVLRMAISGNTEELFDQ